jgi:hypothetical protein
MAWETLEKQLDTAVVWQPSSSLLESSDSDSQETSSEETLERSWKVHNALATNSTFRYMSCEAMLTS